MTAALTSKRNRQTGTHIVVGHATDVGLDDDPEYPWWTICEEHGRVCSHPTLALARVHGAYPNGWCGVCAGTESADEEVEA